MIELTWESRGLWIGAYWEYERMFVDGWRFQIYICLIPTIVLRIWFGCIGKTTPRAAED